MPQFVPPPASSDFVPGTSINLEAVVWQENTEGKLTAQPHIIPFTCNMLCNRHHIIFKCIVVSLGHVESSVVSVIPVHYPHYPIT